MFVHEDITSTEIFKGFKERLAYLKMFDDIRRSKDIRMCLRISRDLKMPKRCLRI